MMNFDIAKYTKKSRTRMGIHLALTHFEQMRYYQNDYPSDTDVIDGIHTNKGRNERAIWSRTMLYTKKLINMQMKHKKQKKWINVII